jgi:hypothetical protein
VAPRTTIIYYTANREEEAFERVIREQILRVAGDIPIISVSQKPINFGYNICIGDVGISNQNAHRQFQIGCEAATTEFVHSAESDTLYPAEYFQYIPELNNRAYRTPIYLYRLGDSRFCLKDASESATAIGRNYAIEAIGESLRGRGEWRDTLEHGREVPNAFRKRNWVPFEIAVPIINIKTVNQMHASHGYRSVVQELPYWGLPKDVDALFA